MSKDFIQDPVFPECPIRNVLVRLSSKWALAVIYTLSGRDTPMRFRDIYLLTTAFENEAHVPERAESGLQGWIDCFGKSSLKGHVFCGGVGAPNEIAGNAKLQEAFKIGMSI